MSGRGGSEAPDLNRPFGRLNQALKTSSLPLRKIDVWAADMLAPA
jgi:hypothetical protein